MSCIVSAVVHSMFLTDSIADKLRLIMFIPTMSVLRRVTGLVLRGICLMRKVEIDWMFRGGAAAIFPQAMKSPALRWRPIVVALCI